MEKLNLLPAVSQECTSVRTLRDNLVAFTTNQSAHVHNKEPSFLEKPSDCSEAYKNYTSEPIYVNNHVASAYNSSKTYSLITVADRIEIAQTDSAYGSETEQNPPSGGDQRPQFLKQPFDSHKGTSSKIFASVAATAKEPKYEKLTDSSKDQNTEKTGTYNDSNDDSSVQKMREDKGHKRSSYIEAIASTDQSMASSSSLKSQECKPNAVVNRKDEDKRKKILRRRSSDFITKKASIDAAKNAAEKARRRSCEVEKSSSSTKLKLPRRLSVDSLGDKKELQKGKQSLDCNNNDSNNKPKIKNSLSTLKKFMRRNSKSNYETLDDETLTTNKNAACAKSTNGTTSYKKPANQQLQSSSTQNVTGNASFNKSSKATNFIERNKKLAETPKASSSSKQSSCSTNAGNNRKTNRIASSSVSEPKTPGKQQQQQQLRKTSNNKTTKSAEKLSVSHRVTDESANIDLRDPTLDVPLLRQRSLTFESRETFMKFGKSPSSILTSKKPTNSSIADTTELDCIEVFTKYDEVFF